MAAIRFRTGKWQARVRRKGYPPIEKTFTTRVDAERWARNTESDIERGQFRDFQTAEKTLFADILLRYKSEVTPSKRGRDAESIRLDALARSPLGKYSMAALTSVVIAEWRNRRLNEVSGSTVNRELNIISAVINTAIREWGHALHVNPVMQIKRPPSNRPPGKRLAPEEEGRLIDELTVAERLHGKFNGAQNPWMKPLVLFALETAMRQGELLGLMWKNIDINNRTAYLPLTKNGESRTVPLSRRAIELLEALPCSASGDVFPLTASAVKQAFRRACKRANVNGIVFHTLRHEAVSRLFERGLNSMEVAAVSGHKTLAMLKRYTHLRAEDLARKLN